MFKNVPLTNYSTPPPPPNQLNEIMRFGIELYSFNAICAIRYSITLLRISNFDKFQCLNNEISPYFYT